MSFLLSNTPYLLYSLSFPTRRSSDLAIHFADDEKYGLAFLDISTGEFLITEGDREYADKLLQSFKPAEIIFQRQLDRKSTRLNSSHLVISYAVFCLKKKKKKYIEH